MKKIIAKREIVPNVHLLEIEAPLISQKAKAGQFVIVMPDEVGERVPFTISDWDAGRGTITLFFLEVGISTMKMARMSAGDELYAVVGPLGRPATIERYGTVVVGGGCYGIGGILPIARALKDAGNRVITVIEGRSKNLLYNQSALRAVSDVFMEGTSDNAHDEPGKVHAVVPELIASGEKIDAAYFIGCTFMMMLVSEATKEFGIPTMTALNPIMLDGTGMCGACRVTVGGKTVFACVTGPFLDGHQIDWEELMQRRGAYAREEVEALPLGPQRRRGTGTGEEASTLPQEPHRRCFEPQEGALSCES